MTHDQLNDLFAASILLELAVRATRDVIPVRAAGPRVGDDHPVAGAEYGAVIPDAPAGRTGLARALQPDGAEVGVDIVDLWHGSPM